jgi:hypothetical protein
MTSLKVVKAIDPGAASPDGIVFDSFGRRRKVRPRERSGSALRRT